MSQEWKRRQVPLKFQLSGLTLFAPELSLNVRDAGLMEETTPVSTLQPPADPLDAGCSGFLIWSLPVQQEQPTLRSLPDYLCYVPSQYQRYYIDLRQSFADYKQKFSSKTRSTINRKIKKFAERCGGDIRWKAYKNAEEIDEFYRLARIVSAKTYQEKLLDAGLPESEEFRRGMETLAAEGRVRGYILFDGERPITYLYCPINRGVLFYQYLGYDPEYISWSVGTILQWYVLEDIFNEGCFRVFDFTEGQSDHKRMFATHSVRCANVYFLRKSLRCTLLVHAHWAMDTFSKWSGDTLQRFGLKAKIKKLIRFAR
ncbi:MAG: GNAT family N-acetyltransferase [Candidatus Rokuibacteriota bacterium]